MNDLQSAIATLQTLVAYPSVSSTSNADISDWVSERLESLGFKIERTEYLDLNQTRKVNVIARRDPSTDLSTSGLAYFCHTDVVPADGWTGPGGDPFDGVVDLNRLYGRGSCDMKGSLVTMMAAAMQFTSTDQHAPLWIVCTADEEVGFAGAKHLVAESPAFREIVSAQPMGLIGEPTRLSVVHAHKGITGFRIRSRGRAAHSSSTDGINANESMVPMLQTLLELNERARTDSTFHDARFDPPTLSWNFGVSDHATAINVTPERSDAWVSLRPMPAIDGEELIAAARTRAESLGLEFEMLHGGGHLWIEPDAPCIRAMCELAGGQPKTVCYGTDGGIFTELEQLVVCGPGDIAKAHTTDEWIELDQLSRGIELYRRVIEHWCT